MSFTLIQIFKLTSIMLTPSSLDPITSGRSRSDTVLGKKRLRPPPMIT